MGSLGCASEEAHHPTRIPSGVSTQPDNVNASQTPHHLEQQRRENRERVRGTGMDPYGQRTDGLMTVAVARSKHSEQADEAEKRLAAAAKAAGKDAGTQPGKEGQTAYDDPRATVKVAGRIVLSRDNGKLLWFNLRDDTGDIQVAVSQRECDPVGFAVAKSTDLADIVIAQGRVTKTRTGEITVWATHLEAASKCLVPPPEKHAGLHDVELRYRQRYIDFWSNPDALKVMKLRSRVVARVRRILDERGYVEVETPVLQPLAGGAAARPFKTHMNALDIPLFMRIAPELYLKRLLVGGLPRVYELSRNFRNEGLDRNHNPEFTMLEAYQAYGDAQTMMELTETIVREVARAVAMEIQDSGGTAGGPGLAGSDATGEASPMAGGVASATGTPARIASTVGDEDSLPGTLLLPFGDKLIDYASPFVRVRYGELFMRALGFSMADHARARQEAAARHIKTKNAKGVELDAWLVVNHLFEEAAEPLLDPTRPTFITHYPAAISPLTRPNRDDPTVADRADLFIGGMELAPHYTELNDPDVQEAIFRQQLAGIDEEESTFRTFDEDFIRALKVGMPPAGGMGLGIDRLMMLVANQSSIRDVLAFPLMRPE